jgi:enoyl-CoA hydratase/carnithine racemase
MATAQVEQSPIVHGGTVTATDFAACYGADVGERLVIVERAEGVATVSLNRPARHNAVNDELHEALDAALAAVVADPAVRVILLRGEGRSFCSGRDTAELGRRVAGEPDLDFLRRHQQSRRVQLDCPKPMVAALKGHVLGGGLEIALACDMRIAATDVRMAFPEVSYGLVTDTGGAPLATMLAGPSRAKRLLMTGDPIDAPTALAWGLVDEVVEPDQLDETARVLCTRLATRPAQLLALSKQLVDQSWDAAVRAGMGAELVAQLALFSQRRNVTDTDSTADTASTNDTASTAYLAGGD